jgi:hypothetical protein
MKEELTIFKKAPLAEGTAIEPAKSGVGASKPCTTLSRCDGGTLIQKIPSHFGRDLAISHPVGCFDTWYAASEFVSFEPFFKLGLCLAGTENQKGFRAMNQDRE